LPELNDRMLFRARRMVDQYVRNLLLPTYQISALAMNMQGLFKFVSLEAVETPSFIWSASVCWLRKFEHNASEHIPSLSILCQRTTQREVCFVF
jgi:hypothetical protein